MRRLSLFGAWLLVLILTTTLTWQIVSAADDRVNDRPDTALNVAAPALAPDSTIFTLDITSTTTIPDPEVRIVTSTTTTVAASPPSTDGSATATTALVTTTTTTTTTTPTTTTTTTTEAVAWSVKTVETSGGTVVLKYRPGEVTYQSATPAAGFQVDVEDPGPPRVEVEFESERDKVEVKAEWKDGKLGIDIEESAVEPDD